MEDLIIIAVIAVLVVVGIRPSIKHFKGQGGCCGGGSASAKKPRKKLKSVLKTKTLIIEGMTCEHCKNRVEQGLNEIEGAAAKVNLKKGEAEVFLERDICDEALRSAVEKAGYRVVSIK